jgi:predicted dithiol-disulfide oxidoreductase (DUF899 family)
MKTVQITPQIALANGKRMMATQFNVVSIQDNLFDHVIFKYTLFDENMVWSGESTYELVGLEQYQTWFATPEGAFEIVAAGIGINIIPVGGKTVFIEAA